MRIVLSPREFCSISIIIKFSANEDRLLVAYDSLINIYELANSTRLIHRIKAKELDEISSLGLSVFLTRSLDELIINGPSHQSLEYVSEALGASKPLLYPLVDGPGEWVAMLNVVDLDKTIMHSFPGLLNYEANKRVMDVDSEGKFALLPGDKNNVIWRANNCYVVDVRSGVKVAKLNYWPLHEPNDPSYCSGLKFFFQNNGKTVVGMGIAQDSSMSIYIWEL
jgi:hypothetical protein